jgi:IclR family transcriptional regulator, acetate operon repressor
VLDESHTRALAVLEVLVRRENGMSLREVRESLDIPRSSAWMIMRQLIDAGYVERADEQTYVVGPRMLHMALQASRFLHHGGASRRVLQDLALSTGLDIYLAVRIGDDVIYADRVFGERSVHVRHSLGTPRPLHASAAGKIFLAYDEDGLWDRSIADADLEAYTSSTVVDKKKLRAQITAARTEGFLHTSGEVLSSISSVAAMAFDNAQQPWAAVIASAHEADLEPRLGEIVDSVRSAANQLTETRSPGLAGATSD